MTARLLRAGITPRIDVGRVFRMLTGLGAIGLFGVSWAVLWGLVPGTPASDEIWLPRTIRDSLQLPESAHPNEQRWALGKLGWIDQVRQSDLQQILAIALPHDDSLSLLGELQGLSSLMVHPPGRSNDLAAAVRDDVLDLRQIDQPQLRHLDCSGVYVLSLRGLENFPHLQSLAINDTPLTTLDGIENAPQLDTLFADLRVGRVRIGQMGPSEAMRELSAVENPLDISALRHLSKLTSLRLRHRGITDIAPLLANRWLFGLDLGENELTSIEGIEQLKNLHVLSLVDNEIEDLSPLLQLPYLKDLFAMGTPATARNEQVIRELQARGVSIDILKLQRRHNQ